MEPVAPRQNCPNCGAANLGNQLRCIYCSWEFAASAPPWVLQPAPLPPPKASVWSSLLSATTIRGAAFTSLGLVIGFGLLQLTTSDEQDRINASNEFVIPEANRGGEERLAPEVSQGPSTDYEFLAYDTFNQPTGLFSPCEPIEYQIDPVNEPPGSRAILELAIQDLEEATGLVFEFRGEFELGPSSNWDALDEPGPVKIVYLKERDFSQLREETGGFSSGDVLAFAGPLMISLNTSRDQFIAHGGRAVFDVTWMEKELSGLSASANQRETKVYTTYLHEMAHVLGLGHVENETQLMHPQLSGRNSSGLGAGDLSGLALAGKGPCGASVDGELVFPRR